MSETTDRRCSSCEAPAVAYWHDAGPFGAGTFYGCAEHAPEGSSGEGPVMTSFDVVSLPLAVTSVSGGYCHDPRHEEPCPLPCAACDEECAVRCAGGHAETAATEES